MGERVWDRFLTEQDIAHLKTTTDSRVGFGSRPALIMVDFYRWVFGDEPRPLLEAVKTWPGSCGMSGWDALPHVQKLLAAAREAGIPVFHLTGLLDSDSGIINWSDAVHVADGPRPKPMDEASRDRHRRRYDIVDELAPIPGEGVLKKAASSGFWGTPLAFELNRRGTDTLIIAGESTSGCVRATVVDAARSDSNSAGVCLRPPRGHSRDQPG